LSAADPGSSLDERDLVAYLRGAGVLDPGVPARVEPAGRGNLNLVRRVRPAHGPSWIVKHAPPCVAGFPDFPLTSERIVFEWRYARILDELAPALAGFAPAVRHFDAAARVLVMEDLGAAPGLESRLAAGEAPLAALLRFGSLLAQVHASSAPRARELEPGFANHEMRRLDGEQMFRAPWTAEVPGLPAELAAARDELRGDAGFQTRIAELAAEYARSREALVHGDAKAPNVLLQGDRPRLIDAEFAHVGDPAFDLGVALGHLLLHTASGEARRAREPAWTALLEGYRGAGAPDARLERALRYAGAVAIAHVVGPSRLHFARTQDALELIAQGRKLTTSG
jgi:S-methyl-5-thioribose kinase